MSTSTRVSQWAPGLVDPTLRKLADESAPSSKDDLTKLVAEAKVEAVKTATFVAAAERLTK